MREQNLNGLHRLNRIPDRILHGGDYNPEQWLDRPDILEKDIEYMKEAHINTVTLGVFSWSVYEPEEGKYCFEWLDKIMDTLYENGIYVILATPSGARPVWMDAKYPEVMRVNEFGVRNTHGVRHNHCMSSPVYRQKVKEMDEILARRYGNHPGLIMWHISNELGGVCYCPLCTERFRQYLKEKYIAIDALNHEWWTTFWSHKFQSFNQIDPPSKRGESSIHGLNLDWKRFTSWNMTDYMKMEIEVFRRLTPDIPVTTNFMRLYRGLNYHEMSREVDIVSWDSYPAWGTDQESLNDTFFQTAFEHAVMRSMKPDRPFLMMESTPSIVNWHKANRLKRPGVHFLSSLQAIACGADSVLYFQWRKGRGSYEQYHGAVIDHLGTNDTRVYKDVEHTGKILENLPEVCKSVGSNQTAIIFDWENRWAIEDMAGLSDRKYYDETVAEIYKILLKHGIDADIVASDSDLRKYKLVIAPMLYMLKDKASENLEKFTLEGGILLATYLTGYVNENALCWLGGFPGNGLRRVFGLYAEEIDSLYENERNHVSFVDGTGISFEVRDFCEILKVQSADVIAVYTRDFYAEMPALTRNCYGKGQAWYLAARPDENGVFSILHRVCMEAGIVWEEIPEGLEIHKRYKEGKCYTFILNTTYHDKEFYGKKIEALSSVIFSSGENVGSCDIMGC